VGFEVDTLTLATGLTCTGTTTPGVFTPGTATFGGTDYVRGVMRVKFAAVTTAPTALWLFMQHYDAASGTATDWYPNGAATALAGFVTALSAKDPNNPPIVGGQVLLTAAPATTDRYSVPFTGFPGATFRLGVLAIGAAAAFTLTVQADMQKWLADST
jgi:hypothetical protein